MVMEEKIVPFENHSFRRPGACWHGLLRERATNREQSMFKVSVMYPNQDGAQFDYAYYRDTHLKLVEQHLKPHGLLRTGMDRGVSGGSGQPAPFLCTGNLYFEEADGYDKGIQAVGTVLRDDIPNFTNVTPVRQISEVVY